MAATTGQINVDALDAVLKQVNVTYGALKALDSQMDATLINKFAKLSQGVNQFVNALRGLDVLKTEIPDLKATTELIKDFFQKIEALNKDLATVSTNLDNSPIVKFSNSFYRLLLSFKDINKIELDPDALDKFKLFFTKMDDIIGSSIKNLTQNVPEVDSSLSFFNTFKNLFLSIAEFMKAIQPAAGQIKPESFVAVAFIFEEINRFVGSLLKTIGGSNIKGLKDIQQNYTNVFSSVLLDVTNFLKNISPFLSTMQGFAFNPAQLKITLDSTATLFLYFNDFIALLLDSIGSSNIRGVAVLLQKDYTGVIPIILQDLAKFLNDFIPFLTLIQSYASSEKNLKKTLAYLLEVFQVVNAFIGDMLATIGNSNIKGFFVVQKNYLDVVPIVLSSVGSFLSQLVPLLTMVMANSSKAKSLINARDFLIDILSELNLFIEDFLTIVGQSNIKGFPIIQKNYLDVIPVVLTNVGNFLTLLVPLFAEMTQIKLTPASVANTTAFLQSIFELLNKFIGDLLATIGNSNIKGFFVIQKSYLDVFPIVLGEVAGFITALAPLFLRLAQTPLTLTDVSNTTLFLSKTFTLLNTFVRDLLDSIGNSNIKGFFIFQKSYLDVFPIVLRSVAEFTGQVFSQFSLLASSMSNMSEIDKTISFVKVLFAHLNVFISDLLASIGNSNIKGFFVVQKSYLDVFPIVLRSVGDFLTAIIPQIVQLTQATAGVSAAQLKNIQLYFSDLLVTFSDFATAILKSVNTSNIRGFFVFQKDYSKVFVVVLESIGTLLGQLGPLIRELSAAKGLSDDFQTRTQFIRSLLDSLSQFIADIIDALPRRNIASIILLRKVFLDAIPLVSGLVSSVVTLISAVGKSNLTAAGAAAFQVVLDSMLTVIRQLYTFTVQTSKSDARKLTTVLPALIAPLDSFARIMTAFAERGTSDIKTSALAAIFASFTQVITIITDATAQIAGRLKVDGYFKTWASTQIFLQQTMTVLNAIQQIFSTASLKQNTSASYKAISEVFANIPKLMMTVQEVVTGILNNSAFTESKGFFALAGLAVKYRIIFGSIRELLNIFNQYLVNIAGLKGISPTLITSVVQIFTAVQQIVAAVLGFEMPKGLLGNAKALFQYGVILPLILGSVRQVTDFFGVLEAAKGVDPKAVVAIGQMYKAVQELATTLLNADTWSKLAADAPKWSSGVKTIIQAIRSISDMIVGLLQAARTVPSESIAGLGNIFKGLGDLFPGLASIISTIAQTVSGNIVAALVRLPIQLISLRNVFGQVMHFITSVIKSTDGFSTDKIAAVGGFARGLGELFGGLGNVFKALAQSDFATINPVKILKNIVSMELVIYPLKRVLNVITENAKSLDSDRLTAVAQFARFVGEALTALGKVFAEVKFHATGIVEIIKSVYLYNKVTAPLLALVKTLANIGGKGTDLKGGADYIQAIAKFLKEFAELLKSDAFVIDESKIKAVAPFFKAITDIFSKTFKVDTKSLKGLKDLAGAADDLKALRSIADTLEALGKVDLSSNGKIDIKVFQGIGDGVIALAKGLDQLSDKQLANLVAVANALSKLPVEALQKALKIDDEPKKDLTQIRDISEDVAQGIQLAAFRALLLNGALKLVGGALSLLDPRRSIQFMVDGFKAATDALTELKTKLLNVFNDIREFGERIRGVGNSILDNFGIGNLINSNAFKATVEFDKLGSSLEVFGGLSKEQRKEAEAFANVLGKDYPLSANEALKATLDLVKAGQSFESAQTILPAAADLASLSDSGSIEQATEFIINATAAFKDFNETVPAGFENAATAVDIISAAADSSTASVEGLSEGLKNSAAVAAGFGLSLEETTGILAIFTDGGLEGAEAGTQLKSFLTNLTTKAAQKELRALGVDLDDAQGNIRPMNDLLNDLNAALNEPVTVKRKISGGLNGAQEEALALAEKAYADAKRREFLIGNDLNATGLGKNAEKKQAEAVQIMQNAEQIIRDIAGSEEEAQFIFAEINRTQLANATSLKKIAGSYGQTGLAILLNEGTDGLKNFLDQMRAVEPASVRAKKALDNINGDMIQLQGSVETLTTKALAPLLEKFFRPFVQLGRFFIDSLLVINDETIEFVATALALGSAFATVIGGLTVVIGALIQLGGAVGSISTLLVFGTKILTIGFLGAITGVIAGLATLIASFAVFAPILAAVTVAFDTLYKIFSTDAGGALSSLQSLGDRVGTILGRIGTAIGSVLTFVGQIFSGGTVASLDEVGRSFANFFGKLQFQLIMFESSGAGAALYDIGQLFEGFSKALSFDAGISEAGDEAAEFVDTFGGAFQGSAASKAKKARDAYFKGYSVFLVNLTKNNALLKSILGDNTLSVEQVQAYLEKAVAYVEQIRSGIGRVFDGFGTAFASAQKVMEAGGGLGDAIGTFVSELGKNLDNSIGGLAATVLRAIGGLFNIKTGAIADIFDTKGFSAGIANLIQKALAGAKKLLLANKDGIKGFLTGIFENIFLGTLNIGKFIADALGQEGLGEFIQGITDSLKAVFGGLVDTVFNLIAGQDIKTALMNAFGPGIQPFLDLVESFGKAVDNIVGFIGLIFSSLFTPPPGAAASDEPFLLQVFNGIVGALTGVIDFLNNNILNFLKTGDIGGMITNLVTSIGTTIQGLDLPTKFATAAGDILNAFISALNTAFLTISTALGFDGQAFLDGINTAMKTAIEGLGDGATVFAIAITAIQALLVTALNGIFTGIAELLDLNPTDIVTKIDGSIGALADTLRNIFGADGTSIFDSITIIVDKLKVAFEALFAVFSSSDATTTAANGPTLQTVLANLFTMLGNITSGVVDTVTDIAEGIDKLVAALALLNPAELLAFTAAMAITGTTLAVYAFGGTILTSLGAGFTALSVGISNVANSFAAKFAAFIVIVQFIRAIAQNLDTFTAALKDLTEGDFIGAISGVLEGIIGVFTDLGFNLLEMLGITTIVGLSREEFHRFGEMVVFVVENAMKRAGGLIKQYIIQPIDDFINLGIPLLLSGLEKARLQGKALLGDQTATLILGIFDNIDATAGGKIDFAATTQEQMDGLATDIAKGGQAALDRLEGTVGLNFGPYFDSAINGFLALPDDPALKAAYAQKVAQFFSLAGVSDQALILAAESGDANFLQALIQGMLDKGVTITPEMQATLVNSIATGFNVLDPAAANGALNQLDLTISALAALELDTTYLEAERAKLQAQIDKFLKTNEPPTPTDVPVTVTPTVTTTDPVVGEGPDPYDPASPNYIGKALITDAAGVVVPLDVNLQPNWKTLDAADDNQIVPTLTEAAQAAVDKVPAISPVVDFDAATLTDPTKVAEFNQLIGTLITNVQSLGTELTGVSTMTTPVTTTLTTIQTAVTTFRDVVVPLFAAVDLAIKPIAASVVSIQTALVLMFATAIAGFPAVALVIIGSVATMSSQFATLRTSAEANLNPVLSKVRDLAGAFKDAAIQAKAFGSAIPTTAGGGGGGKPPGMAGGGSTRAYSAYEVHDTKEPEIYNDGKRTILLTGARGGYVTPASQVPNLSSNRKTNNNEIQRNLATGAVTNNNMTVHQSPVQITVNVSGGKGKDDAKVIADAAKKQLEQIVKQNSPKLADLLRTFHK